MVLVHRNIQVLTLILILIPKIEVPVNGERKIDLQREDEKRELLSENPITFEKERIDAIGVMGRKREVGEDD